LDGGQKAALVGVAGVGFEQADVAEIAGVEADESARAFDLHGDSRRGVGNDQASFINDVDF
jgi:hypothetical protein